MTLLGQTRYDALTDESGVFHFPKVVPGEYFLNIVRAGYVPPSSRSGPFHVDTDTRLSVEMDRLAESRAVSVIPMGGLRRVRNLRWMARATITPKTLTSTATSFWKI